MKLLSLSLSTCCRINLYELIKKNNFQGFSIALIRRFAYALLQCLKLLVRERIIHCDLKPVSVGHCGERGKVSFFEEMGRVSLVRGERDGEGFFREAERRFRSLVREKGRDGEGFFGLKDRERRFLPLVREEREMGRFL